MYTAIRRGKSNPGSMNDLVQRLQDGFVPILRNQPGFRAYYFVNLGNNEAISISVFETKDVAEKSNQLSADWDRKNIADLIPAPPQPSTGEVLVNVTK